MARRKASENDALTRPLTTKTSLPKQAPTKPGRTQTSTFTRIKDSGKKAAPRDTSKRLDVLVADELQARDEYMEPAPDLTAIEDLVRYEPYEADSGDEDNDDSASVASSDVSYYAKNSDPADSWSSDEDNDMTSLQNQCFRKTERKIRSIFVSPTHSRIAYGMLAEESYIEE